MTTRLNTTNILTSSSNSDEEDEVDSEYYGNDHTKVNNTKINQNDSESESDYNNNAEKFVGGDVVVEDENESDSKDQDDLINEKQKIISRIFSFKLPFGGTNVSKEADQKDVSSSKNILPLFKSNSNSSLNLKVLSKILPKSLTDENKLENGKENNNITSAEIKEKLTKYSTISSYEEYVLYQNTKGIKSDRFNAFKKIFIPNPKRMILSGMSPTTENNNKYENLVKEEKLKRLYEYEELPKDFRQHDMKTDEDIEAHEVFTKLKGHVIFINGYRGATLRLKSTNERIWIPLKETILSHNSESNSSIPNLLPLPNTLTRDRLTISPNKGVFAVDEDVTATKILKNVGPIDIMGRLISTLRHISDQKSDLTIWQFPYDWRLALDVTAEQLKQFIETNIKPIEGERNDIFIVAHSMGGLISHKVMTENPLWFRGLIYAGCPSLVPNMLGPLRHGDSILFNKKILTPEASFSFRSSFYFMPQKVYMPDVTEEETTTYGRVNGTSTYVFVNDEDFNVKYDLDYFDPETWKKHKLSPCLDQELRNTEFKDIPFKYSTEEHFEYLKKLLPVVNDFLNSLEYDPLKKGLYPPLAVLYGNSFPTTKGCRVPSLESIKLGEWDNFFYGNGDGVVSEKWLLPQHRGFQKVGKFSSSEGHVALLTDIDGIARCFDYILSEWDK